MLPLIFLVQIGFIVAGCELAFGVLLITGGRLGDLYGHRRLFLAGITLFTVASLACGLANTQGLLVAARAVQGVGGAVVSAVALSLIMNLFTEPGERARAMGVYGFVCAGGGSIGVLLGGVLTSALSWHWIFLVNIPVGVAIYLACLALLPGGKGQAHGQRLDVAGAVTITASLMLAVYAIVNGNAAGWTSLQSLGLLGAAAALLAAFLFIESHVAAPLVPLPLLRLRNLAISNVVGVLWAASMFAWFFLSALYMQLVLGYDAMQVGLAFLPSNLIMAGCSLGLSAWVVMRFGICRTLGWGLLLAAVGLALFALAPTEGRFVIHVLPGMLLLGVGAGIALNPLLLAAMGDVKPEDSGLASGVVNTAFMMGGALVSFLCERLAYRRIRRNGAPNMFLMIAAMGLSNVFQQAANLIFSGQYRSYPFKLPVSTIKVASAYIGVLDLVSLAITAVIITILVYLINKTQFGLNVRAIACNAHAAKVLGVKVDRCIATVFVLAGALAGVAGVLYGMKYNVFPTMGNVGLKAFIASVIGGLGSVGSLGEWDGEGDGCEQQRTDFEHGAQGGAGR